MFLFPRKGLGFGTSLGMRKEIFLCITVELVTNIHWRIADAQILAKEFIQSMQMYVVCYLVARHGGEAAWIMQEKKCDRDCQNSPPLLSDDESIDRVL